MHLNLAYRWFCRLGLEGKVPDPSTFSMNRERRFRESGASGNLPRDFLRRRSQLIGTNRGSSGSPSCEAVPRNGETAWHSNEPAAILGKEWGKASAARRSRNLNHAHKVWL
jgi:hypothetical protein